MKATHYGECQLCGRQQKAPGALLAKHGYTVEWSCFNGVCPGSGHLPFEVSKDQIDARMPAVKNSIADQQAVIDTLRATPLPADQMMVHVYCSHGTKLGGRKGGYTWVTTQVRGEGYGIEYLHPEDRGGKAAWHRMSGGYGQTAQHYFNAAWVAHLEHCKENTEKYLQWLQDRAAQWKPKAQQPVS